MCNNIADVVVDYLDLAKTECSESWNCPMFFDDLGDGKRFFICEDPTERQSTSENSVLYVKKGKYINVLIALPIYLANVL